MEELPDTWEDRASSEELPDKWQDVASNEELPDTREGGFSLLLFFRGAQESSPPLLQIIQSSFQHLGYSQGSAYL